MRRACPSAPRSISDIFVRPPFQAGLPLSVNQENFVKMSPWLYGKSFRQLDDVSQRNIPFAAFYPDDSLQSRKS